jgi:uncharacterized protein (DUF486 family)
MAKLLATHPNQTDSRTMPEDPTLDRPSPYRRRTGPRESRPSESTVSAYLSPIALLLVSNCFMTAAWYGHLRHKSTALWLVILVSWGIAFVEYCFQVPANRLGHQVYSAAQLKIIQEAITLVVFVGFAWWYLGETPRRYEILGMGLVLLGVVVAQFGGGPR